MNIATTSRSRGFTILELLVAIAVIALIVTGAMIVQRNTQEKRNDMRRVTDIDGLRKSLALYAGYTTSYPVMTGCINGSDIVTASLRSRNILSAGDSIVDPTNPNDPTRCYYYVGIGSTYSLRYTLQTTSTAGKAGNVTITP